GGHSTHSCACGPASARLLTAKNANDVASMATSLAGCACERVRLLTCESLKKDRRLDVDEYHRGENGARDTPAPSSVLRTHRADSTAWTESPWTQIDPMAVFSFVPATVTIAPSCTIASTRWAASLGSSIIAPGWPRGTSRPCSVYPRSA